MDFHDKILHQIKNNKLNGQSIDFVISSLCVLNNMPFAEIKKAIDDLLDVQELELNSNQEIVLVNLEAEQNQDEDEWYSKAQYKNRKRAGGKPKAQRLEGKIQASKNGFAFFIPFNAEVADVYIHQDNLNGALNGDSVSIETYKTKRGLEGRVVQIIERGNDKIVGKINLFKGYAFVVSDDVKFGKDVFIPQDKINGASEGDKVVVKIEKYFTNKNPEGQVVEVLGQPNQIETEVMAVIRSYNLYENFPNPVKQAADKVPSEINKADYASRKDFTKDLIFTIDGEDARDLDDAISLVQNDDGTQTLGVHIADVGEYVKLHSVIDNEAFKRATSVYFPNIVLPMLPKTLSNGICSLNEMVDRLALSVLITYNQSTQVVDYKFYESIIKSKKRFTYTEVDKVLENEPEALERNHSFAETLQKMNVLAKKLYEMRDKRGAIDFELPEVKISLNDTGDVLKVEKQPRNDSHKLIESFMIAANEVIAEHFYKQKLPFVYRIHEKPDAEKMNNFLSYAKSFGVTELFNPEAVKPKDLQKLLKSLSDEDIKYVVNRVALRSLKKAKYYPDCLGHFGLGSTYYCHFTSPIRRYPDLTIHRIIKQYLRNQLTGKALTEDKHFVVVSSQVSSEREVIAEKVERDVDDLYKTFYMTHHLGESFEGKINSVTAYGVYVELENTVEGLLKLEDLPADKYEFVENEYTLRGINHTYKIGQRLSVTPVRADILAREIDFILS